MYTRIQDYGIARNVLVMAYGLHYAAELNYYVENVFITVFMCGSRQVLSTGLFNPMISE